jgi:hypothetical protein
VIGFIDHDDFESLLGCEVDLLGLSHFFEQILNDNAVVVANIGRCDFEVVVG